jgi:hypothetical protein
MRVRVLLWIATLLVACCSTSATAATGSTPSLAGTWSGKYSGAYSGTFRLHWRQSGSVLRGSIMLSPGGTFGITGRVNGGAIKFGVVGAGATYTGTVSGKTMHGRYQTATGGGIWSAHKVG